LRLFDAVVTPTMLYGCEAWTLKADQQRRLKSTQRKMLRMVLNAKRRVVTSSSSSNCASASEENDADELEPWPAFLKRTAQWTDEQLEKASLRQWLVEWRRRKWQWASRLLDPDSQRWSTVATKWQPLIHSSSVCGRRQARPRKRWDQDFVEYLTAVWPDVGSTWQQLACDTEWWDSQCAAFSTYGT